VIYSHGPLGPSVGEKISFILTSKPADKESEGYDWIQAYVEISVGGFHGKADLTLTLTDIKKFKEEIDIVYDELVGVAELDTIEDQIKIKMEGDGLGHIKLTGYLKDNVSFGNKLSFEINFDQTFLRGSISGLNTVLKQIEENA
jgi:hypothetical protein